MQEYKKDFAVSPQDRLPTLHLRHKNQFIPNELEVEKQEVDEQARNPRVLRNDTNARTRWKKDDTFWVPRANIIVSLKVPLFYVSAENNVKARSRIWSMMRSRCTHTTRIWLDCRTTSDLILVVCSWTLAAIMISSLCSWIESSQQCGT
jgi:hypothetical protein